YRDEPLVVKRETFHDYDYNWTSEWHDVYDRRVQMNYQMVTMDQEIFDYRPVYQTSTQDVMVVTMRDVTVWETRPIIETQTVLRTEMSQADATTRACGDFAGESIRGQSIQID